MLLGDKVPSLKSLCADPGPEGTFWRLVRAWNPQGIDAWLAEERARGVPVEVQARAVGEMAALIAWSFAQTTGSPDVVPAFLSKLKTYETKHRASGLVVPHG